MKYSHLGLACMLALLISVQPGLAQEQSGKEKYEARLKSLAEQFYSAQKAGTTIKGVMVEGNSLFNGTTEPQKRPYTDAERKVALRSAERNSKVFLLAKDGTLYYPTVKKGQAESESLGAYRFDRVITDEQKLKKTLPWCTLVPMVGREIEVLGEVYPGYGGVKGLFIEAVWFEGDYIPGKK
jgi:hypothetical protein